VTWSDGARRRSPALRQPALIDQRPSSTQLNQTERVRLPFDGASECDAVEVQHLAEVDDAQDQVIDFSDSDHG
jgi:hypothetical protein